MTVPEGARQLLNFISGPESRGDYNRPFGGSKLRPPKPLTQMTLNEVLAWQDASVRAGSASSAAGRYQFIRGTLRETMGRLGLSGNEVWTPELQDRMAFDRMKFRGYDRFVSGAISADAFANNLAKEWAGLPVVTGPKAGRSFYAGDGLNNSGVSVSAFRAAVAGSLTGDAVFFGDTPETSPDRLGPVLPPDVEPPADDAEGGAAPSGAVPFVLGTLRRLLSALTRLFSR